MKKLFLLFILLLVSCTSVEKTAVPSPTSVPPTATPIPTPTPLPQTRPPDFQLLYKWSTGSLPPAYAYVYYITIGTGNTGNIELIPGYEEFDPPYWQKDIAIDESDLDQLYGHLLEIGVFTEAFTQAEEIPAGGQSFSLAIQAFGQNISIPSYVGDKQQSRDIHTVYEEIEKLVPDTVWKELESEQEAYSLENEDN